MKHLWLIRPKRLIAAVLMLGSAWAAHGETVDISGIDGELRANVLAFLTLDDLDPEHSFNPATHRNLKRRTNEQARKALEGFGYYDPTVETQLSISPDVPHRITIEAGPRITVRDVSLQFLDVELSESVDQKIRETFKIQSGSPLLHSDYEAGKRNIQAALLARGYLEADLEVRRLEIDRDRHVADIRLTWRVGPLHTFGGVTFEGSQFDDDFMRRFVEFQPGDVLSRESLTRVSRALTDSNYFSRVEVLPQLNKEDEQHHVPIVVRVTPNPRNVYELGFSYGTDTGVGIQVDATRRWVNDHGHWIRSRLSIATEESTLEAVYTVPDAVRVDRFDAYAAALEHRDNDSYEYDQASVFFARSEQWLGFRRSGSVSYEREDFVIAGEPGQTRLLLGRLGLLKTKADNNLVPTHGFSVSGNLTFGAEALGSDADVVQLGIEGKYINTLGSLTRLITRAQIGSTLVGSLEELPASLRYFAGGDRSVRGYDFESLGPTDEQGRVIGGKHLLELSVELERQINAVWRWAVFSDAGNAFNDSSDELEIGVGLGLRYLSPIGLMRVDVAKGLSEGGGSLRLHIVVGPEL